MPHQKPMSRRGMSYDLDERIASYSFPLTVAIEAMFSHRITSGYIGWPRIFTYFN